MRKDKSNTLSQEVLDQMVLDFVQKSDVGFQMAQLFNLLDEVLFFTKNISGQFMLCNESFAKAMGCSSAKELIGKTDYDYFSPEIADTFVKDDLMVLEQGDSIKNRMEILPNAFHSFDWVMSNKIPLKDTHGVIMGLAGLTSKISTSKTPVGCPPEVYKALNYINENFSRKVTLDELAEISHISVRSLERYFKENFQTTFRKYLHQVRMNSVCHELVYSNQEISKIAQSNGYFDQSHLTAIFSKSLGLTPRQYRLKHGQKNFSSGPGKS
jgi:AraC-like DNA-binding protein